MDQEKPRPTDNENPQGTGDPGLGDPLQAETVTGRVFAKGGGKETLFRVTIRAQVNMIGIMDSKANLIISINAILVTGILGWLTGTTYFNGRPQPFQAADHIPFLVFLIFALVAITFAILATRMELKPRKFRALQSPMQFTLTHYRKVPLEEYMEHMEQLLSSQEKIYDALSLDAYFLSLLISRKSRLLGVSYFFFLTGLITGVVLFLLLKIG